jgi:biotin carboxyl carrier protein
VAPDRRARGRRGLPAADGPDRGATGTGWSSKASPWTSPRTGSTGTSGRLTVAGTTYAVLVAPQGPDYLVEVDGAVHRISGGEAGLVRAPAPAMVVALPGRCGRHRRAGATVAVVESMKLETALRAPFAGRVREVLVPVNTQVEGGTTCFAWSRLGTPPRGVAAAAVGLGPLAARRLAATRTSPSTGGSGRAGRAALAVLGYDVDEPPPARLPRALSAARPRCPTTTRTCSAVSSYHAYLRRPLGAVAQPAWLGGRGDPARRRPRRGTAPSGRTTPRSTCTPSCGPATRTPRGSPSRSGARLRAALAHYGVRDLARRTTMR